MLSHIEPSYMNRIRLATATVDQLDACIYYATGKLPGSKLEYLDIDLQLEEMRREHEAQATTCSHRISFARNMSSFTLIPLSFFLAALSHGNGGYKKRRGPVRPEASP
jgi:hypothetical protein